MTSTVDAAPREGGCTCGAVRYRLHSAPFDVGYCHCGICRRCSGAPVVVYGTVPCADFELLRGEARRYRSTPPGERGFCADCGTPIWMRMADAPDTIDITIASLDAPESVSPTFHIWHASRLPWLELADDLPRFHRSRRGEGGAFAGTPDRGVSGGSRSVPP